MNLFFIEHLIRRCETTKMIKYDEADSFKKDFKKLKKRFKTLDEDLNISKKNAIELFHLCNIDNQSVELIHKMSSKKFQIYKIRKFACKALKGRGVQSGIRIIYAHCLETATVVFLEMYFKADQEKEDKCKVETFLKE